MELPKIDLKNIEFPKVDIKKLKTALSEKTASGDNTEISFNKPDENKDLFMLDGRLADHGIDMWRQMFIGHNKETGDEKIFFIDFIAVTLNPCRRARLQDNRPAHRKTAVSAQKQIHTSTQRRRKKDDLLAVL